MSKYAWIKYEYRLLRRRGYGRIVASIKAVIETFAPLLF